MALMMLVGTSSAWAWSYKLASSNWSCKGNTGWSDVALYTTPTGNSKQNLSVAMLTNPGGGFNILGADNCDEWNGSDHNHCLYVGLSGTAATNTSTIVRATAYWNNGLYSKYTVVVPGGKVYIKPTGGNEVEMTKDSYTYTASVSLSSAQTFDLYGASVTTSSIQNQWDMPSGGKPSSVRLNYTNLTSPYQYVKITYDLKTNQITFTEEAAPCTPPDAPTLTNPAAQCGGSITLPESANELNLKWYDAQTGGNVVSNTEITATETYWAAAVTECESTDRTAYTITINPVPSFTVDPTNLSLCKGSTSVTDLTELSHVVVENGDPVWYDAETAGNVVTTGADLENGGTYWVAAENNETGCVNTERKSFTLKIYDLPKYPDLTKTSAVVCQADETVNLNTLAGVNDVIWYQGEDEVQKPDEISIDEEGIFTYTAKAVNVNGCQSATGVDFKLTVNPLPTINIGEDVTAVLYEDVELTADTDGTSISWEITEGDGSLSSTTGNSVTLTSSSVGTVTVTATATLGSCTATDTHEVEFSAENCADVTTTVEEPVGKIKLLLSKPSWIGGSEKFYCYAWVNNTSTTLLGGWPGTELTQKEGDYYYVVVDANNKDIKIILNDNSEQTVDSDVLNANKIYQISATSSKNSDNKYTFNSKTDKGKYKESVTTTVPAPITAPAAKTISVSTTDGEGNIIFSGQVVKTGCDATNEYGFQYSSDEQTWTTVKVGVNAAAGTAISNNTVTGLDGTYYVRAYITNDNSTQYGAVTEITVSTEKDPITTVTLTHVKNQAGESYSDQELENLTYCVGDIVWFKLEQDGSNFQEYKWISYPGTELRGMYTGGMFQFKITKSGDVGIRLRNDANVDGEGNPTWIESDPLEFNTHPVAMSPTISFENATICSNSTATLKLGSLVVGQSYELYKEIENEGVYSEERVGDVTLTCNSIEDDLKFTGLNESGKYFVKGYTAQCPDYKASSQTATLEIVDASSVYITLNPTEATTTPWMPVKFTVNASDKYTLNVTKGNPAEAATEAEVSQNGNNVSVKIPLPQGSTLPEGTTGVYGQYENVVFPGGATTQYTITATLSATGGDDNPCATPANATITLVPYEEECTIGH